MKILGLIPARFASSRFPGKPLHPIAGQPLLRRVIDRCQLAKSLSEVVVATDDERIAEVARRFCRVEMTRGDHPSGSDRIAEVAARCACDAVVNIQGDEPLMDPAVIDAVAAALDRAEMSTAATLIKQPEEYDNLWLHDGNEALKLAQMRGHMNALMATVDVGPPRFVNY